MKKLLLIGTGIIIAASATLFAAEQMERAANGTAKSGARIAIVINRR
jgi:hypothetical protein